MVEDSYLIEIMKEQLRVTPKEGWNVCILDDQSKLGDRLTVIRHVSTRKEADELAGEFEGEKIFIYGSKDKNG